MIVYNTEMEQEFWKIHTERGNLKVTEIKEERFIFSKLLTSTNVQYSNLLLSSKCVIDTM